ncbi:MAG: tetratricopeptide repeat protein [Oscillochloris sp.]|nr:tetratricopeptide repeat protein [Oscillochloris sp.]
MGRRPTLLPAKVTPPRSHRRLLRRPSLDARLHEALDYRVTLLQAGTGYGKTVALTALSEAGVPLCWYSVGPADSDSQTFLAYLIAAFAAGLPNFSEAPVDALAEGATEGVGWTYALDVLLGVLPEAVHGPTLLVLDDYHFVMASPEVKALTERLIAYAPPDVHVVLASRYPLPGSELVRWRARGDVLEIGRDDLAFDEAEIAALFGQVYGVTLDDSDLAVIAFHTEGWPIALQLIWQGLRGGPARSVADLLAGGGDSLGALFDYLASDVLDHQPAALAAFLRETAILRELTPQACDAVRNATDSAALLRQLRDRDLFVVELGESHYRYHHVFHEFLRQHAVNSAENDLRHRRAAAFFAAKADDEEAVYHWLAACAYNQAAQAIERGGAAALQAGRLDTLAAWTDALPEAVVAERPRLQMLLGDLYRLRSRFDEALTWYASAEQLARSGADPAGVVRALRGQALIYLDQVRSTEAESLLQEALALSDAQADRGMRAKLLELLAENKLNMGKPDAAAQLRAEARALQDVPALEDLLSVRIQLRTGRINAAYATLEQWAAEERRTVAGRPAHAPRGHRETVLILSLIQSLRGEVAPAAAHADEGIAIGERLGSPFVTAVGYVRRGHALQVEVAGWRANVIETRAEAVRCFQRAIALGDRLAVRRIRAEAMWGLARTYGMGGDLAAAMQAAREGIEIARWAGDGWIAAMIELSLAASLVLAGQVAEGLAQLEAVLRGFRACNDMLGLTATSLWMALARSELCRPEEATACFAEALSLAATNGYDYLFVRPTLLGPPDPRRLVPLLIAARNRPAHAEYAGRLLGVLGLTDTQVHPGYQLRVQLLGAFRVWRGNQEIEAREWQRDKARQLFQLLVARRDRWMQRDEICELLWPQLTPEAAGRDFKVALNALNRALEPGRVGDVPAFVIRDGSAYRLRPEADLWIDSEQFVAEGQTGLRLLDIGDSAAGVVALRQALGLYNGDYLPDALYDDWAAVERERLRTLYLRAADRLAMALLAQGRPGEAADICLQMLAQDRCYEHAYRLLMYAQARQGNRPLALRTYQRCAEALYAELGVEPSPETDALHHKIRQGDPLLLPS